MPTWLSAVALMSLILFCFGIIWARFVLPQAAVRAITKALYEMNKRLDVIEKKADAIGEKAEIAAAATVERDTVVAIDLADAIQRADDMPRDGNYGAAADAALRSAHTEDGST